MKPAKKPEVILTLIFLMSGGLWFSLGPPLFLFLNRHLNPLYLNALIEHKALLLTVSIATFIFMGVRIGTSRLLLSRNQYFSLFVNHPVPMGVIDPETKRIIAVNKACSDCYGYSRQEFLSMSSSDLMVDGEWLESSHQPGNPVYNKTGLRKNRKKNGEIFIVEVSTSEIYFKGKKRELHFVHDLTEMVMAKEQKRIADEEKTAQKNFTAFVLENFPVDVAVFDKDHKYILLNKTAVRNDEMRSWMIGKDDFDYFRRKGTDLSMAKIRRERFLKAKAGESTEWIDEHVVNGELKYVLRKFFPYWQDGELKYVYGYGTDITELKKAQMEKDLYLEQLEKIAFTTSHRIRQPICNLQGLISLLQLNEFNNNDDRKQIIECMQASVDNVDGCTRELVLKLHEYKQRLSSNNDNDVSGKTQPRISAKLKEEIGIL